MRRARHTLGRLTIPGAFLLAASLPAASLLGAGAAGAAAPKATATITIKNFMFSPMSVTVKPGAKITVTNKDSTTHTLTGTGSGHFNTGNISHNQSKSITAPTKAGTYHYICNIHQYMTGTIKVS
jgi:plastocyanin